MGNAWKSKAAMQQELVRDKGNDNDKTVAPKDSAFEQAIDAQDEAADVGSFGKTAYNQPLEDGETATTEPQRQEVAPPGTISFATGTKTALQADKYSVDNSSTALMTDSI